MSPDDRPIAPARATWQVLALGGLVPLSVAVGLWYARVPLGCPGRLVYLYSPVFSLRMQAVPVALVLAAALAASVLLMSSARRLRRAGGFLVLAGALTAVGVWAYRAPPAHYEQHFLNLHSMSHDGAFVSEAVRVDAIRTYLHGFPQRARTPPAEMRGTRVISNPPGATLLAVAADRVATGFPALAGWVARPLADEPLPTDLKHRTAVGFIFYGLLAMLWLVAVVPLYGVGRLFFPPGVAAAYAVCCAVTPMTLLFSPGKDPAQLLSVAVPLYLWLRAWRRGGTWTAAAAGAAFTLATVVSLVHVWVSAIVVLSTLLTVGARRADWRAAGLRLLLPAAGGAVVAAVGLYVVADLNLWATARAVARSQAEITHGPGAMPWLWQALGVPLFLLFAGPACWAVGLWAGLRRAGLEPVRDDDARFGRRLVVLSALVMLATVGFTNLETPRLWMPFVPLLLLGGLLQLSALRRPDRRVVVLLAALVFVHVGAAAIQWALMDMRESETRLVEQRFFHRAYEPPR